MIDDQTLKFDSQDSRELQTAKVKIPRGFHTLTWQFSKYINKNGSDYFTEVEIQSISIVGVDQDSQSKCKKCQSGTSTFKASSEKCEHCPANHYLDSINNKCETCPQGTHSESGATSLQQCLQRRPCLPTDIDVVYSNCS
jgi:hypothetical protein